MAKWLPPHHEKLVLCSRNSRRAGICDEPTAETCLAKDEKNACSKESTQLNRLLKNSFLKINSPKPSEKQRRVKIGQLTRWIHSKRVFLSVHERADVARAELHRWFSIVYHKPEGADALGIHGTPEQLRAGIEEMVATGANHLLLNPVCRHAEQLEALAEVVGLG